MKRTVLITLLFISCTFCAFAQRAAVSVDGLKWATLTPNVSVEMLLGNRLTTSVEFAVNPFEQIYSNLYTKQVAISPEIKYWFKRPFYSHYLGVNMFYSTYNVGYDSWRRKGDAVAIGLTYGYSFYIGERWALTPSIGYGVGSFYSGAVEQGQYLPAEHSFKPTVTKLGITISYIID